MPVHEELNHYQRYAIEEFVEEYQARRMSRRELLRRTTFVVGALSSATAVLAAMGCSGDDDAADATPVPVTTAAATSTSSSASAPASPTVAAANPTTGASPVVATGTGQDIRFPGPAGDLLAYLASPTGGAASARYPGVIVIHENQGLLDHFRDIARRYAAEGFVALALDLVSRNGGSRTDGPQNTGFLSQTPPADLAADIGTAAKHLLGLPNVRQGGVGLTGFCFGGGMTFEGVAANADITAAVPYYGSLRAELGAPLKTTKAAFLVMYGGTDTRITGQQDQVRASLQASGRPFEIKVYDGAGHAFFNDTRGSYNEAAAKDAWSRTLAWFRQYLPS